MPNLDEYINKVKVTNDILKKAAKGIESIKNAAMSLESNINGVYKEEKAEKVLQKSAKKENMVEEDIQIVKAADNGSDDNILNLDFNETNLTQAFIYSEVFGKPKSLRRGR